MTLLLIAVAAQFAGAQETDHDRAHHGRVPAAPMSHLGAGWLERPERDTEEMPDDVVAVMELKDGDIVADIGVGSGYFARRMAKKVGPSGKVYGVDIQPEMLKILENMCAKEGITNVVSD